MTNPELKTMTATQLKALAKEAKVKNWWNLKKEELVEALQTTETPFPELTYKESLVLTQYIENDFFVNFKETPSIWTDCFIDEIPHLTSKQVRALLTTLTTKGYLEVAGKGRDSQVAIMQQGIDWLQALKEGKVTAPKAETEDEREIERSEPENIITLKELIIEAKVKGTKARRLLRGSDIERPYKRWEWHKEEHKEIIEKVRKILSK